jgi:hypothetical protein
MSDDPRTFLKQLIDKALWERAGWYATALAHDSEGENPPLIGLLFKDEKLGKQLFEKLKLRLASKDELDELRVSIVDGPVDGQAGQTIHIGAEPKGIAARAKHEGVDLDPKEVNPRGRTNRIPQREGSTNFADFKAAYEKHKSAILTIMQGEAGTGRLLPSLQHMIEKPTVHFRSLADVKPTGDPDAAALPPKK